MERVPVESSSLVSVGYDSGTLTLEIEFKSGTVYQYFDVPENIHAELMNHNSKGTYFSAVIKNNFSFGRL
jgi:hypothetical protein